MFRGTGVGASFFMLTYFWIMLGGALGSGARFWAAEFVAARCGGFLPLGTLFVNVSGSFLIGLFAGLSEVGGPLSMGPAIRGFVLIGIFGGYTTFSSFSLQTLELARAGDWLFVGLNCVLSLVCCLVAVWLGRCAGGLFLTR